MIELLVTSDPVRLSFLRAALAACEIDSFVFEAGAFGGVLASRLMVAEDDAPMARRAIDEAEEAVRR